MLYVEGFGERLVAPFHVIFNISFGVSQNLFEKKWLIIYNEIAFFFLKQDYIETKTLMLKDHNFTVI